MLLALDTATRHSGIALFDGQQVLVELNWYSAAGQTTDLIPRLERLMAWHELKMDSLHAVAVSLGPGSFTGLRVALSAAKGMALAGELPLLGIPTLDTTAYPFVGRGEPVCALVQAGRGRVCWSLYDQQPQNLGPECLSVVAGAWQGWRTPYRLTSLEALAAGIEGAVLMVGELQAATRKRLQELLAERVRLGSPTVAPRRAAVLAELAWARLQAGDLDDAGRLSPIYLREP